MTLDALTVNEVSVFMAHLIIIIANVIHNMFTFLL